MQDPGVALESIPCDNRPQEVGGMGRGRLIGCVLSSAGVIAGVLLIASAGEAGPSVPGVGPVTPQKCPLGYVSTFRRCAPGHPGTYAQPGAPSCTACPAGWPSPAGAVGCTPCPTGQYSATAGAAQCTACAAGTFAQNTGSPSCG